MKKKEICPECSVYTLSLKPSSINIVWDEQNKLKKSKIPQHKRTVEYLINRIISEWNGINENGVITQTILITGIGLSIISELKSKHKAATGMDLTNQQAFNYIMNDYNNLRNK